jgi:hypothetical protein
MDTQQTLKLPERLISSIDLSRTLRELQGLDEALRQAELRKPGEPSKLIRSSVALEEMARINGVALTDKAHREQMIEVLHGFLEHAPRIHMSVAVEPSAKFTQRMIIWLRANIHPLILMEVGLQPTLAAGCMIRTNNKIFDMSLRHKFTENRQLLADSIAAISAKINAAQAAQDPVAAQVTAPPTPAAPAPSQGAPQ